MEVATRVVAATTMSIRFESAEPQLNLPSECFSFILGLLVEFQKFVDMFATVVEPGHLMLPPKFALRVHPVVV